MNKQHKRESLIFKLEDATYEYLRYLERYRLDRDREYWSLAKSALILIKRLENQIDTVGN